MFVSLQENENQEIKYNPQPINYLFTYVATDALLEISLLLEPV